MTDDPEEWRPIWDGLHTTLGRKWAMHVLRQLSEAPMGFNALRRSLDGPTAKTLSARLTELRCAGLVERHVEATSPPATRYELTAGGDRFVRRLRALEREVELVECGCQDDCEVVSVDPERTATLVAEEC